MQNSQNKHFKLKLPHSRAYVSNLEVARFNDVVRPEMYHRRYLSELVRRDGSNTAASMLRSQKMRKTKISYASPDAEA